MQAEVALTSVGPTHPSKVMDGPPLSPLAARRAGSYPPLLVTTLTAFAALLDDQQRHRIAFRAVAEAARRARAGRAAPRELRLPARSRREALRGSAGRIRLELVEVCCDALAAGPASGDLTFGGAVLLPDLTTRAFGPFRLPHFQAEGDAHFFEPPLEVTTFALGPGFGQGCVFALQAGQDDGLGGPQRVPELLEHVLGDVTAQVRDALATGSDGRGRALPVVEEAGRVVALLRGGPGEPETECFTSVIGSPARPFPEGGCTSQATELTFRGGPLRKDAYTFRFQLAALPA